MGSLLSFDIYNHPFLSVGKALLGAEIAATVGGVLCSKGGAITKKVANKGSQVTERIDGTVGAIFQKGISFLYFLGNYTAKSGSLLVRINPLCSSEKGSEIYQLIARDDLLGLKRYLSENPNAINIGARRHLPIHMAAKYGAFQCLQYLISQGVDVDPKDSCQRTPLHYASMCGHARVVEYLLSQRTDVNARTKTGNTPLELAIYNKHPQIEDMLKKAKNLDLTKKVDGDTILHQNIRLNAKIADEIIELENNGINLPNGRDGATPLHLAVARGSTTLARALLKRGAIVGARDHLGRTPMHFAAQKNDLAMVSLLWEYFAPIYVKDQEGKTPADRARENYFRSISKQFAGYQAMVQKNPWFDVMVNQRGEDGKILIEKQNKPITFEYEMDHKTTDLYEKVQSSWDLRSKALLTLFATPFNLPLSIGKQLVGVVFDVGKISLQVFQDAAEQIKSRKLLACLSAITVTPIKNIVSAIALRIWQIVSAPLYAIGMLFAALYTQVNQLNGRKMMNKMAEGWNEMGFLRFMGLAKVGNMSDSKRGGLAQFIDVDSTPELRKKT